MKMSAGDSVGGETYQARCAEALEQALSDVPFYASWKLFDLGPDVPVWDRYAALPSLTKADIRAHFPKGFVPAGVDEEAQLASGAVSYVSTSGSTEDQVTLFWSQEWWNQSERQSWLLNDELRRTADGSHREAVLASPGCVGPCRPGEILSMRERTLGRLLFLNQTINPGFWSAHEISRMMDELAAFRPAVLEADPFYLAALAAFAEDHALTVYQPPVITLTYAYPAEVLLRPVRRVFSAPLVSSYGSTETGYVMMGYAGGRMRQNLASCHIDCEPWGRSVSGREIVRLLVTPFGHPVQRFVRFDIGDLAETDGVGCPWVREEGVTGARMAGRAADVTLTKDGGRVTPADADEALVAFSEVRAFQIDQAADGSIRASLGLAPKTGVGTVKAVRDTLARLYGFSVEVDAVPALRHEPSGKVRLTRRLSSY